MPPGTTINGEVYLDILRQHLKHDMQIKFCKFFMHDGAPCHKKRAVMNWLRDNRIQVIGPWPGNSPDLNPIENAWDHLKTKLEELKPSSITDLKMKINEVWENHFSVDYCKSLIHSMPRRIAAVLKQGGGLSKY